MQGVFPGHVHKTFGGGMLIPTIDTKTHNCVFLDLKSTFASEVPIVEWYFAMEQVYRLLYIAPLFIHSLCVQIQKSPIIYYVNFFFFFHQTIRINFNQKG